MNLRYLSYARGFCAQTSYNERADRTVYHLTDKDKVTCVFQAPRSPESGIPGKEALAIGVCRTDDYGVPILAVSFSELRTRYLSANEETSRPPSAHLSNPIFCTHYRVGTKLRRSQLSTSPPQ